jgi:mannose/fructose/N-acetylgalactosamine-specific phosphotransferase system component IIC
MRPLLIDLALVALFGGLFGLDRRAAFQMMIAQPLVAVPAMGWFMGDLHTGLWLGVLLQLLWMSTVLFGASTPPNEQVAATSIAGMVFTYSHWIGGPTGPDIWAMAILLGAPLSLLGRWADQKIDRANGALAIKADEAAKAGDLRTLGRLPLVGLLRVFSVNAIIVGAGASLGFAMLALFGPIIGSGLKAALTGFTLYFVPALGLAVALADLRRRSALAVALISFGVLLFVLDITVSQ